MFSLSGWGLTLGIVLVCVAGVALCFSIFIMNLLVPLSPYQVYLCSFPVPFLVSQVPLGNSLSSKYSSGEVSVLWLQIGFPQLLTKTLVPSKDSTSPQHGSGISAECQPMSLFKHVTCVFSQVEQTEDMKIK